MDNLSPPPGLRRSGSTESDDFSIVPQRSRAAGRLIRKTSAEIVSEAKSMLAGGGTRLVSARRPITPREPKRQLYGYGVAPPGRPPSAINLKYLQQQESRALPLLEPLHTSGPTASCSFSRSESIDSIDYNGAAGDTVVLSATVKRREKLPAIIHIPHKGVNSLENPAAVGSSNEDKSTYHKPVAESKKTAPLVASTDSIVKNHPLKRMAAPSADDKSPKVETTEPHKGKDKIALQNQAKLLRRSNEVLVQTSTESLLEMLKAYAGLKECTETDIVHISAILDELFVRVKGSKGSWRGAVLGALYGLVEASSPKILLSVACVVLAMNVTGSNLTGACKLVFKIARNEHNDNLFMGSEVPELLVDGLGRASPIDDSEACIYGYGAVRFLAGSANAPNAGDKRDQCTNDDTAAQRSLAVRLVNHGLGQLMVLHLKMINEAASTKSLTGAPLHALFQLSGALRTLADTFTTLQMNDDKLSDRPPYSGEADAEDMAQIDQAVPLLVRAAEMCINELEVQANIIRTLSVLSERSECCEQLAETAPRLGILLGSVTQTSSTVEKGLATVNRLGYILGNVMARWDAARVQFYNCDVSCDALLACLDYYANKSFTWKNQMGDSIVNVLTKLIRIVANMCVNGDVGYGMSKRSPLGEILLSVLLKVRDHKTAELEELLFATLGALHNLSYYYEVNDTQTTLLVIPGSICERLKDICGTLCSILDSDYNPARSEVARVLGNMTRSSLVRQVFGEENGLKILKGCLTSGDDELIVTSCGVLVNILGDWVQRGPFQEIDGPSIVRRILRRGVTNRDWIMAAIASQAIWNYLNDTGDILQMLTKSEIDLISGDLAEGLDEESLFRANEPDHFWEDFAPVATDLLERLQFCISEENSICETSEDDATDGARYG